MGCPPRSREFDTHKEPGPRSRLPTRAEVDEPIATKKDYGDFSDGLEDIHNQIHGWVGGRCGDMNHIAFELMILSFWSHHAMIDRIWQMSPGHSLPLYLYDEVLESFNLTVRKVLNIYELGYDYAGQQ